MQKSLKTFGLAGVAMALVMTPAMAAAQDQSGSDTTTETMPRPWQVSEAQPSAVQRK
jgi:hypothetical protein